MVTERASRTGLAATVAIAALVAALAAWAVTAWRDRPVPSDAELRATLAAHQVAALDVPDDQDAALVGLGRALFFDPVLSGNRDISCATCHHPTQASGDGLSLSIGTGGEGLGPDRDLADGDLIPRNAPDVFNRGLAGWTTMFWDSRVSGSVASGFETPAGTALPDGLDGVLAAQAMFPVTSAAEMRGFRGDTDVFGAHNEMADVHSGDLPAIWAALMDRLLAIDEYRTMFAAAYPNVPEEDLGFQHAANAIAAFEIAGFTFVDSPFQRYLAGDDAALDDAAKRGASLFFGPAGCAACHTGPLLTDQLTHDIGVPQIGPGKDGEGPEDHGRARETGNPDDMYAFRTPSLHNVELTGPWMHDGAFTSLEAVIRHHVDPEDSLTGYDVGQAIGPTIHFLDPASFRQAILNNLDPMLDVPELSDDEIADLVAFLESLTDPAARDLAALVPESVPSGLLVD
jgi:cytochrome c peroxidase